MTELQPLDTLPANLVDTELDEPLVALLEATQASTFSLSEEFPEPSASVEDFANDELLM